MTHGFLRVSFCALLFVGCASWAGCSSARHGVANTNDAGVQTDAGAAGLVTQVVRTSGTPDDASDQFKGSDDPTAAPTVVYPADGVLLPPNLSELEVQWKPAAGTSLFELHFVSTLLDLTVYTICNPIGDGCGYEPDETVWALINTQSRGDTVQLTVRAKGADGIGAAPTQKMSFTEEDLLGGLYYWAAADGEIVRYDFGNRGQAAEVFYGATEAGAICVGCHSLARNGERIAVGLNAPVPTAGLRVLDVATKTKLFDSASNFEAFSPDGSRALVNSGGDLALVDAMTGTAVGTAPAITNGNLPDWSADGTQVAFARNGLTGCPIPGLCDAIPGVTGASIFTVPVTGDNFGTPVQIVSGGGNNFYPTFSPDGSVIAFNRSASAAASFDAADALVWAVSASGGTPVALTNSASTVGDSWPKFAPFSHHFKGDTIFWLTFSSRRDYGLRLINSIYPPPMSSDDTDMRISQVWMVAVPQSAIMSGTMPAGGYPAFWLPFQSMKSGNHIAQWTEKIARQPCSQVDANPCPNGETCQNGMCVGVPIL